MKKLLFILLIIYANYLFAQKGNFDKSTYYSYGTNIYMEAYSLPGEKADSSQVIVMFKILYDALPFKQVNPLENPGAYLAVPEVEIVFADSDGIIRRRASWSDSLWVNSFIETNSKDKYTSGFLTLYMPPSKYDITIQIIDKYKQSNDKAEFEIDLNRNLNKSQIVSMPFFGFVKDKNYPNLIEPYILDGNLPFSSSDSKVILFSSIDSKLCDFSYQITKIKAENTEYFNDTVNLSGKADANFNKRLMPPQNKKEIFWKLTDRSEGNISDSNICLVSFDLPANILTPGKYKMTVKNSITKDSIYKEFDVLWTDMPLSLQDVEYASRAMYYILNDDEYDNLRKGSTREIAKKISDYWKKFDPTPLTPFNEALYQYFKRVDYAFFNFQTIKERDGAKTERGKIYILNGPPDNISNEFVNSKTRETWEYKKLRKTFIFEIGDKGIFVLTSIKE